MKRASGSVPEARGLLAVHLINRLSTSRRSGIAVDGGRLVVWTVVGPMLRAWVGLVMRLSAMMRLSAVAVATRLLVPRIDMSAAGADTTREEGTVVVIAACVATPPQDQRGRGKGTAAVTVAMTATIMTSIVLAFVKTTVIHHRGSGTVAVAARATIPERRASCPGTTPLDASEAVALVDVAESPRDIDQFIVDRIANIGQAMRMMTGVVGAGPVALIPALVVLIVVSAIVAVAVISISCFACLTLAIRKFNSAAIAVHIFAILTNTCTWLFGPQRRASS